MGLRVESAYNGLAIIERPTIEDARAPNLLRNAVIYTGRKWQCRR